MKRRSKFQITKTAGIKCYFFCNMKFRSPFNLYIKLNKYSINAIRIVPT